MDWRARHRLQCKSFGVVSLPSIHVPSANTNDLKNTLVHLSKTFITGGEEREWNPAATRWQKTLVDVSLLSEEGAIAFPFATGFVGSYVG
jgi:hypothetical protein